tara:strand:+ start:368 stop:784 length:417 start_codon:yes stop_codon:yes gene_type:complete
MRTIRALSLSLSFLLSRDDLSSFILFPSLFLAARVSIASDRDRFFPILRRGVSYAHTSSSFSYTQIKSPGLRKRPGTGSGSNIAAKGGAANSSILKFYTDDSPGLKITPVVVLVMSVCFIGFVTILHAMSKIYQYKMS